MREGHQIYRMSYGTFILITLAQVILTMSTAAEDGGEYRLPRDVIPRHYDYKFFFDINEQRNFSYYGVADILLTTQKSTQKIIFHGVNYHIQEDAVTFSKTAVPLSVTKIQRNPSKDFIIFDLDRSLNPGENVTMTVPFYGNLENSLEGIYISKYTDKQSGKKEWIVTTQFEPTYARKSFPCFDEPALKATFKISILRPDDFVAVSNMPLDDTKKINNEYEWFWKHATKPIIGNDRWSFDTFQNSVPMSTYLLAMIVSKFKYVTSDPSLSKTTFKIWARKDATDQTAYASRIGPMILSYYEEYFGIKFPLPKQDMFAIPDFSAGAMENWGLITYRETALLYDEKESGLASKERVAEVVAHELAHQWFGNLVTMEWWSDLWLNEGFATYVSGVGVNSVEPTWNYLDIQAVENMWTLFELDALQSSHPVSATVMNPDTIDEIFDAISYKKGSNIIRMMNAFLTEPVFRDGINNYLIKHSYSNAQQDDLWTSLTQSAMKHNILSRNVTVKQIMDTWTKQTGYPVLEVTRNYEDSTVKVKQSRYLALPTKSQSEESWWIPLNLMSESEVNRSSKSQLHWLSDKEGNTKHHQLDYRPKKDEWMLANPDFTAIMRVNYDPRNWELLTNALKSDAYTNVPMLSRTQLLGDSFELARTNRLDYSTPLKLVTYLEKETEYLPVEGGLKGLYSIEKILRRTKDFGAYQKFVRKLITPIYQNVGGIYTKSIRDPDDLIMVKMQVLTSSWACRTRLPQCEENAIDMFDDWMQVADPDNNNPIPVDLRKIVYSVAIRRGSVEHWAFLYQRYHNSNVAYAKNVMLAALTSTNEIWLLKQLLEWCVTPESEIRSQDAPMVMSNTASSNTGYFVFKEFLYQRIDDIYKAFHGRSRTVGRVVAPLVNQFTAQHELDEFLEWRQKNSKYLEGSKLTIDQAAETAKVNIAWLKEHSENVVRKLREYSQ